MTLFQVTGPTFTQYLSFLL